MKDQIRAAVATLPNSYSTTIRRRTSADGHYSVRISIPGTTRAITVTFWFSPIDQKWLVSFKDKTGFEEGKGLIPPDAAYIEPFLESALKQL